MGESKLQPWKKQDKGLKISMIKDNQKSISVFDKR